MIFLLLATLLAITAGAYFLFDRDFFSPAVVLSALFAFCTAFSLYNYNRWEMWNFHAETYWLIVWGVLVFVGVCYLIKKLMPAKADLQPTKESGCESQVVPINWAMLALITLFGIAVLIYFWTQVKRIAVLDGYKGGGLWTMMRDYRNLHSYSVLPANEDLPWLLYQCVKLLTAFSFVYLYQFINNLIAGGFRKKNLVLLVPVLLSVVQILMDAGRLNILHLAAAGLIMLYILWQRAHGWKARLRKKQLLLTAGFVVILLFAFYLMASVVGRKQYGDIIYNLSIYIGGPTKLFDLYLQKPVVADTIWGQETFYSLRSFLSKYGFSDASRYIRHLEYRSVNGIPIGNVYTAFRRYYQDFGFVGLTVLQAINALVFSTFYTFLKRPARRWANISLLIYAFIVYTLFILPIDDLLFSSVLSPALITTILLLVVAWWAIFIFRWRDLRHPSRLISAIRKPRA